MSPASPFGRRSLVAALSAERTPTETGDLRRFLSAFAGGFVFFSILIF